MGDDLVARFRQRCRPLPGVTEKVSHGAPAFFAVRQFAMIWPKGHHEVRRPQAWLAAPPGVQAAAIAEDPERFFRPPYVGARGWVGVMLDREVDWDELAERCEDAYRAVAPARLVAELDRSAHCSVPDSDS